jgi:DNA-binding MarR family transcriptional regulator
MAEIKSVARTMYLMRQVTLQSRLRIEQALQDFELTSSQYTVLSILGHREGLSAAQLARRFSVTPQSMNAIISTLEDKKLISRQEASGNRRILRANLTRMGQRVLAVCEEAVDVVEADLFRGLTKAETAALRQLLLKVVATIREDATVSA